MATTPRIYVGTYAKYNAGNLHGAWLDLEDYDSREAFYDACRELHKDEADPEFMFQDWEGIPDGKVGESWLADDLWDWLELEDDTREIVSLYWDEVDDSATIEQAREAYSGVYESPEDYAESFHESTGANLGPLANYIDWERVARDMRLNGLHFVRHDGHTYVFNPA